MTVLYVDVSHHDRNRRGRPLDWNRIRAATSPVMCARATYGDPQVFSPPSRYFGEFITGAAAAGFQLLGGYHNLTRGDQASIRRQVDYLRSELDRHGANWAMLDVERYPELVTNGLWPRVDDVRQFSDRWHAVDDRVLTVYLPRWIWDSHLDRPDLRPLGCPLIASDYGPNTSGAPTTVYATRGGDTGRGWTTYGGLTPAIWQYGSNIDCPGASGATDCNAYRGTLTQLRALLTEGDDTMALEDIQRQLAEIRSLVIKGSVTSDNALFYWLRTAADQHDDLVARAFGTGASAPGRKQISEQLAALRAEVAQLAGRDLVNEQQLAADLAPVLAPALLATLTPEAIAAAIPPTIAQRVADELSTRLQG